LLSQQGQIAEKRLSGLVTTVNSTRVVVANEASVQLAVALEQEEIKVSRDAVSNDRLIRELEAEDGRLSLQFGTDRLSVELKPFNVLVIRRAFSPFEQELLLEDTLQKVAYVFRVLIPIISCLTATIGASECSV